MERLTRCVGFQNDKPIYKTNIDMRKIGSVDELKNALGHYEDLEEQGLLMKLPIPIGTTVYKFDPLVSGKKEYIKTRVSRYDVFDDSVWFCFLNGLGRNIEDFGKYVFLTQAEAEEKLKEMKS